ncbi:hypothetical protein V1284_006988 [Nitrobacteraceae bacterium AZCC 2299]
MDAIYVGIDVSKDRLDVAVRPGGESFAVGRSGAGIDELIDRLKARWPMLVAIEATGGFETVVAAGLAGAGPIVRPGTRQARQDRPDRCHGDRAFCRSDQTAAATAA